MPERGVKESRSQEIRIGLAARFVGTGGAGLVLVLLWLLPMNGGAADDGRPAASNKETDRDGDGLPDDLELRLANEFKFRVVLHHVSDASLVANEIAKAGAPVSLIFIDSPGGKQEALNASFTSGAALEKAGVLTGFHTDDGVTDSRVFLRSAGLAVRGGMSREKALYAVTLANAKILDLDSRVGSLEPGKDADFIVLSGDPLSVYTHVLETWIEGKKVFDRSDPKYHTYAVGGVGASDPGDEYIDEEER